MRNIGSADRLIRVVVGVILLLGVFMLGWGVGWVHWLLALIGIVMLGTAAVGYCPLYSLLGIRSDRA